MIYKYTDIIYQLLIIKKKQSELKSIVASKVMKEF